METESVKGGKKYVIGVTGYTGCGKTFVCTLLKELLSESKVLNPFQPVVSINSSSKTCAILNADEMAKELRDHHEEVKQQIKSILGDEVYDQSGKSIPQKINEIIFDPKNIRKRVAYENIFNIWIPKQVVQTIESEEDKIEVLILDFYVIFNYLRSCLHLIDKFILVNASEETQLKRLTDANGRNINEELAKTRISNQRRAEPLEGILHRVHFVINNDFNKSTEDIKTELNQIIQQLQI